MKQLLILMLISLFIGALPAQAQEITLSKTAPTTAYVATTAKTKKAKQKIPPAWPPVTPPNYTPIKWVKARGVISFTKAPDENGFSNYLTFIYLPYNKIIFITSSSSRVAWATGTPPLDNEKISNWAFPKMAVEHAKENNRRASFIWDVPFHNVTIRTTDLSLALKSSDAQGAYMTSGSRPPNDMLQPRRLLIINNKKSLAKIVDFDPTIFQNEPDQIVEGFAPQVVPTGANTTSARLYIGVKPNHKTLVVFCSRAASPEEASEALSEAGVPLENQLEGDGGGSTTCAYNLPGQYFVEPGRMLPHLMAAFPKK